MALRYVRLVLWSFFGIRRRADATEEIDKARPLRVVVTAVLLALVFVALLVWLASMAVGAFG